MASKRRVITKAERKHRDGLMRVVNWTTLLVVKRLFDEGKTVGDVALLYDQIQRESGSTALAHATPDWHYVDETQVAERVYQSVTGGE